MVSETRHEGQSTPDRARIPWGLISAHVVAYLVCLFGFDAPSLTVFVIALVLGALLIWISCVDFARFEIPDVASALLALTGAMGLILLPSELRLPHLFAGLGFALLLFGVGFAFRALRDLDGLGFGDVKLAVGIGLWVGPLGVVSVLLGASLSALGALLIMALVRGHSLREIQGMGIAFGPFLCLFTWVVWLQGMSA